MISHKEKEVESQVLVIFGASGDLTSRKLLPEIFNLFRKGYIPENYAIIGVGRSNYSDSSYRDKVVINNPYFKKKEKRAKEIEKFSELVDYISLDTGDPSAYAALKHKLQQILPGHVLTRMLFFTSPPRPCCTKRSPIIWLLTILIWRKRDGSG